MFFIVKGVIISQYQGAYKDVSKVKEYMPSAWWAPLKRHLSLLDVEAFYHLYFNIPVY